MGLINTIADYHLLFLLKNEELAGKVVQDNDNGIHHGLGDKVIYTGIQKQPHATIINGKRTDPHGHELGKALPRAPCAEDKLAVGPVGEEHCDKERQCIGRDVPHHKVQQFE